MCLQLSLYLANLGMCLSLALLKGQGHIHAQKYAFFTFCGDIGLYSPSRPTLLKKILLPRIRNLIKYEISQAYV